MPTQPTQSGTSRDWKNWTARQQRFAQEAARTGKVLLDSLQQTPASIPTTQVMADPSAAGSAQSDYSAERKAALRELFSALGYYEELQRAVAAGDSAWIATVAKKQFLQLPTPAAQARFLRGYARLFPDIAARDPWYMGLRQLIPDLEDTASPLDTVNVAPHETHRALGGSEQPRRKFKSNSQLCAASIAKIHAELHRLLPSIEAGQEDYERLQKANPQFLTFKAVLGSPQLQEQLLALPARRGQFIGLAQKLAGVLHGRKPHTVKKDWKLFKPVSFRRSQ